MNPLYNTVCPATHKYVKSFKISSSSNFKLLKKRMPYFVFMCHHSYNTVIKQSSSLAFKSDISATVPVVYKRPMGKL